VGPDDIDPAECARVTWSADGRIAAIETPRGTSRFTYDAAHRVTRYGDIAFDRDARGRVIATHDGDDVIRYTYDGDRLVAVDGPGDDNMHIAYDRAGRAVHVTLGGLEKSIDATFAYDCAPAATSR
jgi:YD repeat-containing protein